MTELVSIASYRTWIDEKLTDPEQHALLLNALNAFERLESVTCDSNREIVPILEAARSRFTIWEIGVELLNRLAVNHSAAQDALELMLRDSSARVRFQSIALLGVSSIPSSVSMSLIRLGLRDKSSQVRGKVAEAVLRLGLDELLPELEESLRAEKHPSARQSLEFHVALLRDGYLLQREDGRTTNVWVRGEHKRGYCISVPVTDADISTGRLESIISEARSRLKWSLAE